MSFFRQTFFRHILLIFALLLLYNFTKEIRGGNRDMIRFKFDVASALETTGITSYKARNIGLFSSETWLKIKAQDTNISMKSMNKLCVILNMKLEDLIVYVPDKKGEK